MTKKKVMRQAWVYACSWLLGANKRIVGVEVVEHAAEAQESESQYNETKGGGIWATFVRQDSVELTKWAREHYEKELSSTVIPIRAACGRVPTIRIERAETADAPPNSEENEAVQAIRALALKYRGAHVNANTILGDVLDVLEAPGGDVVDERLRKARAERDKWRAEAATLRAEAKAAERKAFAEVVHVFDEGVPVRKEVVDYCRERINLIDREACKPESSVE
jgi:hypothetical protein